MASLADGAEQRLELMETHEVAAGEPLELHFEAQPGSGAMWQAPAPPPGNCEVTAAGVRSGAGEGIGGPADQVFVVVCREPGEYTLEFALKRSWESQVRATRRIVVKAR
jgi:Chagasin family peptidase inhibitor I42